MRWAVFEPNGEPLWSQLRLSIGTFLNDLLRQGAFQGTAREAAAGFPANVNVAAALGLAGIGSDRTTIEIWADPGVERNCHTTSCHHA